MNLDPLTTIAMREELHARICAILVSRLDVRCRPDAIDPDAPLFGIGLGLDSVDAIELTVAIETELGVELPDGDASLSVLRSVGRIVDFVVGERTGGAS